MSGEHDVEDDEVGARGLGFVECAVFGGDDVGACEARRRRGGRGCWVCRQRRAVLPLFQVKGFSVLHDAECFR